MKFTPASVWGAEDQDNGEREPEGRTASVSQSPNSGRCPGWVRRCWVIKKPWRTSAALVVITHLHVGQPHGPSVPRPVADFDGLVRHLVCGIHHSQDDHAIGEGEADEYMPGWQSGEGERCPSSQLDGPSPTSPDLSWILAIERDLLTTHPPRHTHTSQYLCLSPLPPGSCSKLWHVRFSASRTQVKVLVAQSCLTLQRHGL